MNNRLKEQVLLS